MATITIALVTLAAIWLIVWLRRPAPIPRVAGFDMQIRALDGEWADERPVVTFTVTPQGHQNFFYCGRPGRYERPAATENHGHRGNTDRLLSLVENLATTRTTTGAGSSDEVAWLRNQVGEANGFQRKVARSGYKNAVRGNERLTGLIADALKEGRRGA